MRAASRKLSRSWPADSARFTSAKRFASITLVLAFLFGTLAGSPAQASGSCTKVNAVKVVSGTKFVCKKVGNKIQWVKQGSNSVVNNQPSSPAPTTTVREWTKCPAAGRTSGSGAKGFVCVKYASKLQWVKNSTLDTPMPKRPCRSEGLIGNWQGEVLLCTPASSGRTWQIPVFDEEVEATPDEPTGLTQYRLNALDCHSKATTADVEVQEAGSWKKLKSADYVSNSSCGAGYFRIQATVDLIPGTVARIRVYTTRWSWVTSPLTVGSVQDVTLYNTTGTSLNPATARVAHPTSVAGLNISIEFVSYQFTNGDAVFRFRLTERSNALLFTSAQSFTSSRGSAAIVGQPASGTLLNPRGEFEIRVKQSSIQWDLTRFEFDFYGQGAGSNYVFRIATDFTWR
jgi:hypothetical protein